MTMTEPELKDGRVVGIAGPVIDVEFPRGALPELNAALEFDIVIDGEPSPVVDPAAFPLYARATPTVVSVGPVRRKPVDLHTRKQHQCNP